MIKYLLSSCIWLYQVTVSPDHSLLGRVLFPRGVCRFQPTCSEYTRQAILLHGPSQGLRLGWQQLKVCR